VAEVEVRAEEKRLPRIEYKNPNMNKINLITTHKGEEGQKEENMLT